MSRRSDDKSKSKTVRITRTSTCLDVFDHSEVRHACDKCRKYLDPLHNSKKRGGASCDQLWLSHHAKHRENRIALRHREVCNYLEYPEGITFEEECACLKKGSEREVQEMEVDVEIPSLGIEDGKENTSPAESHISDLTSSSSSSRKVRRRHNNVNRITISME